MDETTITADLDMANAAAETLVVEPALVEELLVEEISIDGMCGVY